MPTFKMYFSINCYSFTFLILIYNVLAKLELFPQMTVNEVFIYFLMTFCITVLIALTDLLPVRNQWLASLIRIIDTAIVVFGVGLVFRLFPLDWIYIVPIIAMILLIYFGVCAVLMIKDKADADAINERLSRRLTEAGKAEGDRRG